ncbi:MAG TPA: hypothetical protein VGO93_17390 [Candidatus Xenobia bacterium]
MGPSPIACRVAARKETPEASPVADAARAAQAAQLDEDTAREIYHAMELQRQQVQLRMAQLLAEFHTTLVETWQSVILRRVKVADALADAWVKMLTH